MRILRGFTRIERLILWVSIGVIIASIAVFVVFCIPILLNRPAHVGFPYLEPEKIQIPPALESFFMDNNRYPVSSERSQGISDIALEGGRIGLPLAGNRFLLKSSTPYWPADFDGPLRLPPLIYAPSNGTACLGLIVNDERRHGGR